MIRCPIWQCGGEMHPVERDRPKGLTDDDSYPGDWQQPDLVCDNCGAIYRIIGYKKVKNKSKIKDKE